jgi:hypothetical protein
MEELLETLFSIRSVPKLRVYMKPSQSAVRVRDNEGVRWSPACKDVSPEAEERLPFEVVAEQRN